MPSCVSVSCAFHSINYILFLSNLVFHFTRLQVSFSFITTLLGSLNNSKLYHVVDRTMTDLRMSLTFFNLSKIFFVNEQLPLFIWHSKFGMLYVGIRRSYYEYSFDKCWITDDTPVIWKLWKFPRSTKENTQLRNTSTEKFLSILKH